jgi:hypothetical protein
MLQLFGTGARVIASANVASRDVASKCTFPASTVMGRTNYD